MANALTGTQLFALDLLRRYRTMAIGGSNSSGRKTLATGTAQVLVARGLATIADGRIVLVEAP